MTTESSGGERQDQDRAPLSEEDARRFVEQLRSAPAEEIVADVFSTLLNAAQIKLGRRDARLFIDLCALTLDYARNHLSDELGKQIENALGQLRLGQVSAEREIAEKGESEPNDLSQAPTPPTTGEQAHTSSSGQSSSPSPKLWVPGR